MARSTKTTTTAAAAEPETTPDVDESTPTPEQATTDAQEPAGDVDEGQAPAAPVATEPGCQHPDCVLDHPHPGPAIVDQAAADAERHDQAAARVAAAVAELVDAAGAAAALRPGGGYVIATTALYVPGGARAHNPGDRVPVGNVDRNGWAGGVRAPAAGE